MRRYFRQNILRNHEDQSVSRGDCWAGVAGNGLRGEQAQIDCDVRDGLELVTRAAQMGYNPSILRLAEVHDFGEWEYPRDLKAALPWVLMAALHGDMPRARSVPFSGRDTRPACSWPLNFHGNPNSCREVRMSKNWLGWCSALPGRS